MKLTQKRCLAFALAWLASLTFPLHATVYWVSNTDDSGPGSLRETILQANQNLEAEIRFHPTPTARTITLSSPLPSLAANITLAGPGVGLLTISGSNYFPVLSISVGTTSIVSGLTIADGFIDNLSSPDVPILGAGIHNFGCLKLFNCTIRDCTLLGPDQAAGAGICNSGTMIMRQCDLLDCGDPFFVASCVGGGIANYGNLSMEDCKVSGCFVHFGGEGGGIANFANLVLTNCLIESCAAAADADGGGIYSDGNLTMHGCVISNCVSSSGGGVQAHGNSQIINSTIVDNEGDLGGGFWLAGTNTMLGCVINGNRSGVGGGVYVAQGIADSHGYLSMFNCTISGNYASRAQAGGGISGQARLNHCTIAYNQVGGGIAGSITSQDTIFAFNDGNDVAGVLTSEGYNLIQNIAGCTILGDESGNIYGADPRLGPLQNNGGPTWTHALLMGSPAIDSGTSGGLATDQRGAPRPFDVPGIPNIADGSDIGAFEWAPPGLTIAALDLEQLIARLNELGIPRARALAATLQAALAAINRGSFGAAINQLRAFQHKVRPQLSPRDSSLAQEFIVAAQQIMDLLSNSRSGKPPRMHTLKHRPHGNAQLRFDGPAGQLHFVEASTDLVNWATLGVASENADGTFQFEDADAPSFPNRFYRIQQLLP